MELAESITLQREAAVALHTQISDAMRARISSGEWPPHYRLKPEPALAEELGVSRGTLRRALTTLTEEGLLTQTQGRGTFVTSALIEPGIAQKLSSLSEDFATRGVAATTRVLEAALIESPAAIASLLDLSPGEQVLRLRRIRDTASGPVAMLVNYVSTRLAPGIEQIDFAANSLFEVLEGTYHLKIASGRRTFSAEAASADVAEALDLVAGAPVQYLEQVTYLADDRPIEYSDVWIDSAKLRVTSVLSRR